MVNVDFADVRTVMSGMGDALMGIGTASGEHRAIEAAQNALSSPILEGMLNLWCTRLACEHHGRTEHDDVRGE
jgi:hypothetical protein